MIPLKINYKYMKKTIVFILCLAFSLNQGYSQDIHFSQFQASPHLLNPANTGNYNGDYRVGLHYRNQWASFIKPFVTYAGFFDKKFKKELLGKDFWGAGIALYSDKAGTAEFGTQVAQLALGYHKRLGADKHLVSVGVQGSVVQKGINYDNLKFGNQYESVFYNSELENNESYASNSIIYPQIQAGLNWQFKYSEKLNFNAGFSMFNLNSPKESFYTDSDNRLNTRFTINAGSDIKYDEKITIRPAILLSGQTKATEFILGSDIGYKVKDVPLLKVEALFGIYYRSSDALILIPGLQYNNYRFGISYDVNLSSLRAASKGHGAIEISIIYIFNQNPKLGIKRNLPCKRL